MFCINCGTQLPDNAKFCFKCGAPIGQIISNPQIVGDQNIPKNTFEDRISTVINEIKSKFKVVPAVELQTWDQRETPTHESPGCLGYPEEQKKIVNDFIVKCEKRCNKKLKNLEKRKRNALKILAENPKSGAYYFIIAELISKKRAGISITNEALFWYKRAYACNDAFSALSASALSKIYNPEIMGENDDNSHKNKEYSSKMFDSSLILYANCAEKIGEVDEAIGYIGLARYFDSQDENEIVNLLMEKAEDCLRKIYKSDTVESAYAALMMAQISSDNNKAHKWSQMALKAYEKLIDNPKDNRYGLYSYGLAETYLADPLLTDINDIADSWYKEANNALRSIRSPGAEFMGSDRRQADLLDDLYNVKSSAYFNRLPNLIQAPRDILIGSNTIHLNTVSCALLKIHQSFQLAKDIHQNLFSKYYRKKVKCLDDVFEKAIPYLGNLFDKLFDVYFDVVEEYIGWENLGEGFSEAPNDKTKALIIENYKAEIMEKFSQHDFQQLAIEYTMCTNLDELVNERAKINKEIDELKPDLVMGGGFGLSGFISGSVKATLMNKAVDAFRSINRSLEAGKDQYEADQIKEEIFKSFDNEKIIKNILSEYIERMYDETHLEDLFPSMISVSNLCNDRDLEADTSSCTASSSDANTDNQSEDQPIKELCEEIQFTVNNYSIYYLNTIVELGKMIINDSADFEALFELATLSGYNYLLSIEIIKENHSSVSRNNKIKKLLKNDETTIPLYTATTQTELQCINCVISFSRKKKTNLRDKKEKIYLIDNEFIIDYSLTNIRYKSLGAVKVNVRSNTIIDWRERNITFDSGIIFDDDYRLVEERYKAQLRGDDHKIAYEYWDFIAFAIADLTALEYEIDKEKYPDRIQYTSWDEVEKIGNVGAAFANIRRHECESRNIPIDYHRLDDIWVYSKLPTLRGIITRCLLVDYFKEDDIFGDYKFTEKCLRIFPELESDWNSFYRNSLMELKELMEKENSLDAGIAGVLLGLRLSDYADSENFNKARKILYPYMDAGGTIGAIATYWLGKSYPIKGLLGGRPEKGKELLGEALERLVRIPLSYFKNNPIDTTASPRSNMKFNNPSAISRATLNKIKCQSKKLTKYKGLIYYYLGNFYYAGHYNFVHEDKEKAFIYYQLAADFSLSKELSFYSINKAIIKIIQILLLDRSQKNSDQFSKWLSAYQNIEKHVLSINNLLAADLGISYIRNCDYVKQLHVKNVPIPLPDKDAINKIENRCLDLLTDVSKNGSDINKAISLILLGLYHPQNHAEDYIDKAQKILLPLSKGNNLVGGIASYWLAKTYTINSNIHDENALIQSNFIAERAFEILSTIKELAVTPNQKESDPNDEDNEAMEAETLREKNQNILLKTGKFIIDKDTGNAIYDFFKESDLQPKTVLLNKFEITLSDSVVKYAKLRRAFIYNTENYITGFILHFERFIKNTSLPEVLKRLECLKNKIIEDVDRSKIISINLSDFRNQIDNIISKEESAEISRFKNELIELQNTKATPQEVNRNVEVFNKFFYQMIDSIFFHGVYEILVQKQVLQEVSFKGDDAEKLYVSTIEKFNMGQSTREQTILSLCRCIEMNPYEVKYAYSMYRCNRRIFHDLMKFEYATGLNCKLAKEILQSSPIENENTLKKYPMTHEWVNGRLVFNQDDLDCVFISAWRNLCLDDQDYIDKKDNNTLKILLFDNTFRVKNSSGINYIGFGKVTAIIDDEELVDETGLYAQFKNIKFDKATQKLVSGNSVYRDAYNNIKESSPGFLELYLADILINGYGLNVKKDVSQGAYYLEKAYNYHSLASILACDELIHLCKKNLAGYNKRDIGLWENRKHELLIRDNFDHDGKRLRVLYENTSENLKLIYNTSDEDYDLAVKFIAAAKLYILLGNSPDSMQWRESAMSIYHEIDPSYFKMLVWKNYYDVLMLYFWNAKMSLHYSKVTSDEEIKEKEFTNAMENFQSVYKIIIENIPEKTTKDTLWYQERVDIEKERTKKEETRTRKKEAAEDLINKNRRDYLENVSSHDKLPDYMYSGQMLEHIKLPENITEIGAGAFYNCPNLKAIKIPAGIKKIGNHAFANCPKLHNISFLSKQCEIGDNVFLGTNVVVECIDGSDWYNYCKNNMVEYLITGSENAAQTLLPSYSYYEIQDTVIKIPANIEQIEKEVFVNCNRLKTIYLSSQLHIIKGQLFKNCAIEEPIDVYCPSLSCKISEEAFEGTPVVLHADKASTWYKYAQKHNISFMEKSLCYEDILLMPEKNKEYHDKIANKLPTFTQSRFQSEISLYGKDELGIVKSGIFFKKSSDKREYFWAKQAKLNGDDNWDHLVEMIKENNDNPSGVSLDGKRQITIHRWKTMLMRVIDRRAYYKSDVLYVSYSSKLQFIGCEAFRESQIIAFKGDDVQAIWDRGFIHCTNLRLIILGDVLKEIGDYAFAFCPNLKEINIPPSVKSIGENIFYKSSQVTVHCEKGSLIEKYCIDNNIKFVSQNT